jgi:hypothetical protein
MTTEDFYNQNFENKNLTQNQEINKKDHLDTTPTNIDKKITISLNVNYEKGKGETDTVTISNNENEIEIKENINKFDVNFTSQFILGDEFIISPYVENVLSYLYLPNLENYHFYDFSNGELLNSKEKILNITGKKAVRKIIIPGSIIPWTETVG